MQSYLDLDNITLRVGIRELLPGTSWRMNADENWAIVGPNGSGKSSLVKAILGQVPLKRGCIRYPFISTSAHPSMAEIRQSIGYVSFELGQHLLEQESREEEHRAFSGRGQAMAARQIVLSGITQEREVSPVDLEVLDHIVRQFDLASLVERPFTALSTGEMRRVLIARAVMKSPRLLILDEPFDGLDEGSRGQLYSLIDGLMRDGMRVILITHRLDELPNAITHVMLLGDDGVQLAAPSMDVLQSEQAHHLFAVAGQSFQPVEQERSNRRLGEILIEMHDVTVRYGDTIALNHLTWTMRAGEHWAILGPNGAGKSTVLRLLLGDHLQGYANHLVLFGRRKGTGESVREIKQQIGYVSGEFQTQYRKRMSVLDVVASGFYDSIGLYHRPTAAQATSAQDQLNRLSIADLSERDFHELSYGQKRLVLIARALVKSPTLLILDEPCHGLDDQNRRRVLEVIEQIGQRASSSLLYVTHHRSEILPCISHVLRLQKGTVCESGLRATSTRHPEAASAEGSP